MKRLFLVLSTWGLGSLVTAAPQPSLQAIGDPFDGRELEIIWAAPTNKLPTNLDVYEAVPTTYSPEMISNLVALTQFTESEKACAVLRRACQGKKAVFEDPQTRQSLTISPASGYIDYFNHTATALPGAKIQGVPSDLEVLELTLKLLPKLGIKETDLAHKSDGPELQRHGILEEIGSFDKQDRKITKKPILRGVILFRQLNGVSLTGPGDCGGVRAEFGNNAVIKELAVSWRNLKAHRKISLADPTQITQRIKEGKAVINLPPGLREVSPIRKLTITRVNLYYLGQSGDEEQKFTYPYAMLTATTDIGHTNIALTLNCPILK